MSMSTPPTNDTNDTKSFDRIIDDQLFVEKEYDRALPIFLAAREMIKGCPGTSAAIKTARPLLYAAHTVAEFRAAASHFRKTSTRSPGVRAGKELLKKAEKICYNAENPKKKAMPAIDVPDAPADAGSSVGGSAASNDTEDDEDIDVATPPEPELAKPGPLGGAAASAPDLTGAKVSAIACDAFVVKMPELKPAPEIKPEPAQAWSAALTGAAAADIHDEYSGIIVAPPPSPPKITVDLTMDSEDDEPVKPPRKKAPASDDDKPVSSAGGKSKAPASDDDDELKKLDDERRKPARKKFRAFGGSMAKARDSDDDDTNVKVVYAEMMGAWEPEITEKMKELERRKKYSYEKMSINAKFALRTMPKPLALKSLDNVLTEKNIFDVNEYLITFTEGLRKIHNVTERSDDEDEESDDEAKSLSDEKVTYGWDLEDDCWDNLVLTVMKELHGMKKCSFGALNCDATFQLQTLPNFVAETLLAQLRDDSRIIADVSTYIIKNGQQLRRDWRVDDPRTIWQKMQAEHKADDASDSQAEVEESQEDGGRRDPDENGGSLEY